MKRFFAPLIALLLSGCVFDPNYRDIALIDGKAYNIPVETMSHRVNRNMENHLKNIGIYSCEEGDIFWISKYDLDAYSGSDYAIKNYFYRSLAGCSKPMTSQELVSALSASQGSYDWQDAGMVWQNAFYNNAATAQDAANALEIENQKMRDRLWLQQQGRFHQIQGL